MYDTIIQSLSHAKAFTHFNKGNKLNALDVTSKNHYLTQLIQIACFLFFFFWRISMKKFALANMLRKTVHLPTVLYTQLST